MFTLGDVIVFKSYIYAILKVRIVNILVLNIIIVLVSILPRPSFIIAAKL